MSSSSRQADVDSTRLSLWNCQRVQIVIDNLYKIAVIQLNPEHELPIREYCNFWVKAQNCCCCRQISSFLPDFLYEEGEAVRGMVIAELGGLAKNIVVSSRNTSCSLWMLITAGNGTNIIGNIVRFIIGRVGGNIIVKIIVKPISTKLERKWDGEIFKLSEGLDLEEVSWRGWVGVLVSLLVVDGGNVGNLWVDVETAQ